MRDARDVVFDAFATGFRPPPRLLPSEWANTRRQLSPEASAEPGQWRNARAPHLVMPMDALSPYHPAEQVVCLFSSQSGKTEVVLNVIGFGIEMDPGPMLAIQPNVSPMGEAFSKDRISPMLRDTPSLRALVGDPTTRNASSTVTHKKFPGGHLTIAGANSPAGLASRPIRYLFGDELDRWETTREGNPLLLARKRLQTFRVRGRSKELLVSSPTFDDIGISVEYGNCTQQWERHLVCTACNATQYPRLEHFTPTAEYVCEHCGHTHPAAVQDRLKLHGEWVCVKDEGLQRIGFKMNQWSSPFARWQDTLAEWAAAEDPADKQVVTNTVFAEGWRGEGEQADPGVLRQREEAWVQDVPDGVRLITMGCDVQGDRLEVEAVGWGAGWESWSLGYEVLPGEPESDAAWEALRDFWLTPWDTTYGPMRAAALAVDSSAFTKHVYAWVKLMRTPTIFPVKGVGGAGREPVLMDRRARAKRTARRMIRGAPPEPLGVDEIKSMVYRSLARPIVSGTACSHFPAGRSDEYYAQLTGERLMAVRRRGQRARRVWMQQHAAVEALDCRVYAWAAALLLDLRDPRDHEPVVRRAAPSAPKPLAAVAAPAIGPSLVPSGVGTRRGFGKPGWEF